MARVTVDHVFKRYSGGVEAVSDLSLEVADGEFVVLVGPSGCGKTTALRMVAGLEAISDGTISVGDRIVNDLSPRERDVAMVFQNYALYPHMTVAENIGFALKLQHLPKAEIETRVTDAAKTLGLTEHLRRKPSQLSGGQRQRVAMGRAIVRQPAVFLMDEPLSNLDAKLRVQMRAEIMRIQRHLSVTTLYVTHDQTEAMTMGDRVAVLRDGRLQQIDRPQVLYDEPANVFVAAFIGSPAMNLYEATISSDGREIVLGDQRLALPARFATSNALGRFLERPVLVGIRPEHLHEAGAPGTQPGRELVGDVELVESLGSELLVHFRIGASRVHTADAMTSTASAEEVMDLQRGEFGSAAMSEGIARMTPGLKFRIGEPARFSVELERLHLFDPETAEVIRPNAAFGD